MQINLETLAQMSPSDRAKALEILRSSEILKQADDYPELLAAAGASAKEVRAARLR